MEQQKEHTGSPTIELTKHVQDYVGATPAEYVPVKVGNLRKTVSYVQEKVNSWVSKSKEVIDHEINGGEEIIFTDQDTEKRIPYVPRCKSTLIS